MEGRGSTRYAWVVSALDREIDELYQLPPERFTAARNELAKRVASDDKARVRALRKPTAPAWAVNQLYWRARPAWDALVGAAEQLRDAHKAALRGRTVDLRKADAAHREALARALKETLDLVSSAGHSTSALRDSVMRTLQALPADIHAGRLDAPLAPAGFGLLEGFTPARAPLRIVEKKPAAPAAKEAPATKTAPLDRQAERRRAQEEKRARAQAAKEAQRARLEAERQRREEAQRAARQARRVAALTKAVERAQKTEDDLRARLRRAEEARAAAQRQLERANPR